MFHLVGVLGLDLQAQGYVVSVFKEKVVLALVGD